MPEPVATLTVELAERSYPIHIGAGLLARADLIVPHLKQKKAVIEKVTQALVEAVGAPQQNVRVWIHDVPKENWGIAGVSAKDLGR